MLIINIITRINLGAFRQESTTQSAPNHIRGTLATIVKDRATMKQWDAFISHASEDKDSFVRELYQTLTNFGLKIWYDEFTLKVGDSLSKSIDSGLLNSDFGIMIISQSFLNKGWPEYEYRSLLSREIGNKPVILPIWYNVTKDEVSQYSLYLADKFAISADDKTICRLPIFSIL